MTCGTRELSVRYDRPKKTSWLYDSDDSESILKAIFLRETLEAANNDAELMVQDTRGFDGDGIHPSRRFPPP